MCSLGSWAPRRLLPTKLNHSSGSGRCTRWIRQYVQGASCRSATSCRFPRRARLVSATRGCTASCTQLPILRREQWPSSPRWVQGPSWPVRGRSGFRSMVVWSSLAVARRCLNGENSCKYEVLLSFEDRELPYQESYSELKGAWAASRLRGFINISARSELPRSMRKWH